MNGLPSDKINRLLQLMNDRGASDLHLAVASPPVLRISGDIEALRYRSLSPNDFETFIKPITPEIYWEACRKKGEIDFAYHLEGVGRFRVNLFKQEHGMSAVFRIIPDKVLTINELGLPAQVRKFAEMSQGLVLITGPTGSGKSTTLAAMIDYVNSNRNFHIITVEDPIEFVHVNKKSLISQRELGRHALSFPDALRAAVREDPDCILVGELRDLETINTALRAAETGILVFGTLHTNSAAKSIDRMIGAFPAEEQEETRIVLSSVLRGIISQQLLKGKEGGRVAALEILFSSGAVASMIRENKSSMISSLIQTGKKQGMISMDQCLQDYVSREIVSAGDAYEKALDKESFKTFLKTNGMPAPARTFETA